MGPPIAFPLIHLRSPCNIHIVQSPTIRPILPIVHSTRTLFQILSRRLLCPVVLLAIGLICNNASSSPWHPTNIRADVARFGNDSMAAGIGTFMVQEVPTSLSILNPSHAMPPSPLL